MHSLLGTNGFVWWIGVIENRQDPLKLGRCKVRIFGRHADDITVMPTDDLPWASVVLPVNNTTVYTAREGDTVMGFFMDGDAAQFPVIMGMFHGIPEDKPNSETGFNDQRTTDQLKASPKIGRAHV